MDPIDLLSKFFPEPEAFRIVLEHSRLVAAKAVAIARTLEGPVDIPFVEEAALLHDIGICRTFSPGIGCFGNDHYISHGIHGRAILEAEGLPRHALVCERHIGVGLTKDDIIAQDLSLPYRNMSPTTLEEEIISFADLFYSKKPATLAQEKSIDAVRHSLRAFGDHKAVIFDQWLVRFATSP